MPFTLAHPAVILPLCHRLRHPGAVSALLIGSMTPDFVYWLPLPIYREMSHTIPALFTFCLPAGFSVFLLYQLLIKRPILALLPRAIAARLPPPQTFPWHLRHIALVLVAVLLDAITHLAWDAFTHYNTPMTRLLPFLETPLFTGNGYVIRIYKVLQHGSTVVGIGVLARFSWHWYQRTSPPNDMGRQGLAAWQKVVWIAYLIVPSVLCTRRYPKRFAPSPLGSLTPGLAKISDVRGCRRHRDFQHYADHVRFAVAMD